MRAQSDDKEDINNKGDGVMDKKREVKEKKRGGKKDQKIRMGVVTSTTQKQKQNLSSCCPAIPTSSLPLIIIMP